MTSHTEIKLMYILLAHNQVLTDGKLLLNKMYFSVVNSLQPQCILINGSLE